MTPVTLSIFILGLAIILVASFVVAAPLFQETSRSTAIETDLERERWERQKRQAIAAIKEIELDHRLGKVSDQDLVRMRGRFEGQALEAMAALDQGQPAKGQA